jgi:hypothetical protein
MKCLAGTKGMGIEYGDNQSFVGYSDNHLGGSQCDQCSITGYAIMLSMLHGGAVSWKCRLQSTIVDLPCKAEFKTAAEAIKEALWFKKLLSDLGLSCHERG